MAGDGITFNNKAVMELFGKIASNVDAVENKSQDFWSGISSVAFRDVIDHFEKQSGPDGKWKQWSNLYAEYMASIGKSDNNILQDTGRLRQSLQIADTSSRIKQGQLLFNPAQSEGGKPYAYNHDTGSGGMPQRKFMWLSDKGMNTISKITAAYLLKGTK